MSQFRDNHNLTDNSFFNGAGNRFIRWYFYLNKGLAAFNEFRYLIMTVFGAYYLLKLNNLFILSLMFVVSVLFLTTLGWLFVIKVNKVIDYLNVHFSTVWTKHQMALAEDSVRLLESINDNIKSRT